MTSQRRNREATGVTVASGQVKGVCSDVPRVTEMKHHVLALHHGAHLPRVTRSQGTGPGCPALFRTVKATRDTTAEPSRTSERNVCLQGAPEPGTEKARCAWWPWLGGSAVAAFASWWGHGAPLSGDTEYNLRC